MEKEDVVAEAEVRQRVEDYAKAIGAKDIDGVMSSYAPTIVSFDLNPPLRYAGTDNKRRAWQEFFAAYAGPVVYEINELSVATDGELAFVHSLNHVNGTLANGHVNDLWVRWTACFRRIDGVWLVVHDHVSVPADLAGGQSLTMAPTKGERRSDSPENCRTGESDLRQSDLRQSDLCQSIGMRSADVRNRHRFGPGSDTTTCYLSCK